MPREPTLTHNPLPDEPLDEGDGLGVGEGARVVEPAAGVRTGAVLGGDAGAVAATLDSVVPPDPPDPEPRPPGAVGLGLGLAPGAGLLVGPALAPWLPLLPDGPVAPPRRPDGAGLLPTGMPCAALPVGAAPKIVPPRDACGSCTTRIDSPDARTRNVAPATTPMTGSALPAGCLRTTAPARAKDVRTRSASNATASCVTGSGGPMFIRLCCRSLRSTALRSTWVRVGSRYNTVCRP
jgi:hypothetical protein